MSRIARTLVVLTIAAVISGFVAGEALALYRQLSTKLSGPAIGGITPEGDAKVDQSKLPEEPPLLELRIKNVNLPDGTVLTVTASGPNAQQRCVPMFGEAVVGTITLSRQEGSLTANMPFEVGRQDQLLVKNGSTIVLCGGQTWDV
jgi:hypothetical protein